MALGEIISRLSVELALNSAAFEKNAAKAGRSSKDLGDRMERMGNRVGTAMRGVIALGSAIAGSMVVGKLYDMAKAGLEHAGSLGEQAAQLGVTTSALQQYRYIATQVGISQDEMDKGLAKLSITLGKLSLGTDKQRAALEKYGFSQKEANDLSKLSAEQALPVLADKYKALASETDKAAFVAELFGSRMGSKFKTLLEGGADGIDAMTAAYKRLGIEISGADIAAADKALDEMAANQAAIDAQIAKTASQHAGSLAKTQIAWSNLKLQAITTLAETITRLENFNRDYYSKYVKFANSIAVIDITGGIKKAYARYVEFAEQVPAKLAAMVSRIGEIITGRLSAVWEGAKAKIEAAKKAFYNLADAVVFNSYIPDMVDGIALQMARLDAVMVNPAKTAAERTKQVFEKLTGDIDGLMRRLFPDAAATAGFRGDRAALQAGIAAGGMAGYTVAQLEEALKALQSEEFKDAFKDFQVATNDNARIAEVANVRVAKSFKDMAETTLSALDRVAGAIRGGGFLDILSSVIGLGLQLGSVGLFGKKIAGNINKSVPGYAGGTNFHPGGLAVVGERGPELVNLPRGAQVHKNGSFGGTVHNHFSGNLMTPEFWAMIQQGDIAAAQGGSMLARAQRARSDKWSLSQ